MFQKFFLVVLFLPFLSISQNSVTLKITDKITGDPLPFATISFNQKKTGLASVQGEFFLELKKVPAKVSVSYIGYEKKQVVIDSKDITFIEILLEPKEENLKTVTLQDGGNKASELVKKAILTKNQNNPQEKLPRYQYKTYHKFKITRNNTANLRSDDTSKIAIKHIFNKSHSFLSEKISQYVYQKGKKEKETILATRMTGFDKPVYDVLGVTIQSTSLYENDYVIFDNQYAGPLSKNAFNNYYYKILDTIQESRPAYVVLFQPKRSKKIASIEGLLYLDTQSLAIQKAVVELQGELRVKATHNFSYLEKQKVWFPSEQKITIQPGTGNQKISLFGGSISIGRLSDGSQNDPDANFLEASTDFFDFDDKNTEKIQGTQSEIQIATDADKRPDAFWEQYRTRDLTEKDANSFSKIDSIVKAQHIERKIAIAQGFATGYYPIGFFDFDLTYPIKYNQFEGVRIGVGGVTNEKLSDHFRMEGYVVYGFRDRSFKYGLGAGYLLNKNNETWLNINYTDDLRELASLFYLTDKRVYSLFEPRLVNINAYYRHRTWSSSLQYRIFPQLLTETQLSVSDIKQTGGYQFIQDDTAFSRYRMAESTIALLWSPNSSYLKSPRGFKEIREEYPKITAQYTKGWKGVIDSDFEYSKFGMKTEYIINRIDQSSTSFLLEGSIALGDIPLTHLFHAYPNAPTKETILQRFSVAGRRSFETMYYSEFFSDRLATLQIKHQFRPLNIWQTFRPEFILITRYALGDIDNPENHIGVSTNSLRHLYQESGFEINKLFAGFGLSFAYRYGAYHLPEIGDNLAFKFTFYLKL